MLLTPGQLSFMRLAATLDRFTMEPGDIVQRPISLGGLGLPGWHPGILVRDRQVVHLQPSGVHREPLDSYAAGLPVLIGGRPINPARTVGRAMSRVGERGTWRLFNANCMDFVAWCAELPRVAATGPMPGFVRKRSR